MISSRSVNSTSSAGGSVPSSGGGSGAEGDPDAGRPEPAVSGGLSGQWAEGGSATRRRAGELGGTGGGATRRTTSPSAGRASCPRELLPAADRIADGWKPDGGADAGGAGGTSGRRDGTV